MKRFSIIDRWRFPKTAKFGVRNHRKIPRLSNIIHVVPPAFELREAPVEPRVKLIFKGTFYNDHYDNISLNYMSYFLSIDHGNNLIENITEVLKLPVANLSEMDSAKEVKRSLEITLHYHDYEKIQLNSSTLLLNLQTNFNASFPVNFAYDPSPLDKEIGIIYAAIVLFGLYSMIIWELVHRTFAAIIASVMSIGE